MRSTFCLFLIPLMMLSAWAENENASPTRAEADPAYQAALDANLKIHPPGDYHERPVRQFVGNATNERRITAEQVVEIVMRPVEKPDKDVKTLFSEAAEFWVEGRIDLAMKRYKEVLSVDPENEKAKAVLYDYVVILCMDHAGTSQHEINSRYEALKKKVAGDIIAPAEKEE